MKPVRLIIAVALLAVVGGALWWSNRDEKAKEGKPAADAPPQILSIKPDDVKQLEIKRQGRDAITVVFNDKGKWDITAPKAYPADATAVAALTSGVFEVPSERVIDPNVTDLAAYGLRPPVLEVDVLNKSGKTSKLLIGENTPTGTAVYAKVDGDPMNLNWVDWDNDRHQEGWGAYMNLGVESWRRWLTDRIAETIDRYGVDAYFLDIIGGWTNNTKADMHEGARLLVAELRSRYPNVLACGEFHYDALLEFIPFYHVHSKFGVPYARYFSHLSHPAPGRGSSGVHESGFSPFDPKTLSLPKAEGLIPTLSVVDDTFTAQRDQMAAIIAEARIRAGI